MSKLIFPFIILILGSFFIYQTWTTHKVSETNFAHGQKFLLDNEKRSDVNTTNSGLQYEILNNGSGKIHPSFSSAVKVHYHGTLIDKTVFDSSVDRGEPITFPLNKVIQGWQEGLQLMVVGDKFRFFIPSNLAYGKNGSGPIPPGTTLIFEIELIDIR